MTYKMPEFLEGIYLHFADFVGISKEALQCLYVDFGQQIFF